MIKIRDAFDHGKAFVAFITCGDPDLETTAAVVRSAVKNGADLIELGIPFSDPTAEGPVIQGANLRALSGGVTTDQIFDLVRVLRNDVTVPMVFMTYANVVYSYGAEIFISTCQKIGIQGLILPDLPYEEKEEFLDLCHRYEVDLISLIAPTSDDRIAMIAEEAEGFVYLVSKPTLLPSSRRFGSIRRSPVPSDSASHGRNRPELWRLSPMAPSSVRLLSRSSNSMEGMRPLR